MLILHYFPIDSTPVPRIYALRFETCYQILCNTQVPPTQLFFHLCLHIDFSFKANVIWINYLLPLFISIPQSIPSIKIKLFQSNLKVPQQKA